MERLLGLQRMSLLDVLLPFVTVLERDGDADGMAQFTDAQSLSHQYLPPLLQAG